LAEAGIDAREVADQLEREGVRKFAGPYDRLIGHIEERQTALLHHEQLHSSR
jgi:hypothetical protein